MSLKTLFSFLLIAIVVASCKKKIVESNNLFKFKSHVNYNTSGRVSILSSIDIGLVKEVEGWIANEEIHDGILTTTPKVEGKLIAKNGRALIFIPNEPLKPDTDYTVTLKLGKLYPNIPTEYTDYTFQFKTIKPNFNVITNALQSYSKEWQYIEGIIKLADATKLEDVKTLIEATQNSKTLSIKWDESNNAAQNFEFKIDSIHREIEDSKITVSWNGKTIKAKNKGENSIRIPGINNFFDS